MATSDKSEAEKRNTCEKDEQTPATHKPYDAFFKAAFSRPQAACELIQNFLPELYSSKAVRSQLRVEIKNYINHHLAEHQSDLLVSCKSGDRALYFYFLLEHKSSPQKESLLQLGRYLFELMYELIDKRQKKGEKEVGATDSSTRRWLPEIVPVIIYHGRRPWNYPKQFADQINSIDRSAAHLLRFEPVFVILQSYRDEQFFGSLRTVVALMLLKNLSRRFTRKTARNLLKTMYSKRVPDYLRQFYNQCFEALFQVKDEQEIGLLIGEFEKAGYNKEKEGMMTFAEKLEKRGIQKGRHDTLIRQLDKKFGISEKEKELIRHCYELEKVENALDEILDAKTKEEVLKHLS